MKFSYAIALSLLGHGMLFMPWGDSAEFAVSNSNPAFAVVLVEPQQAVSSAAHQPVAQPRPAVTHTSKAPAEQPHPPTAGQQITATVKPPAQRPTTAESTPVTLPSPEIRAYVISRLHHELEQYFRYPLLARRNGWQGKVVLGLNVDARGSIGNVHIKSGSGYHILDQSALDAMLKIRQIQASEHWFATDKLEIIIPVIYRLQKG